MSTATSRRLRRLGHVAALAALATVGWTAPRPAQAQLPILDTTPPTVRITAPAPGTTVSGGVRLAATASDNLLVVVGVQFRVDGTNVGGEDLLPPYEIQWNSAAVANGSHTVTAIARDLVGNRGTAPAITIVVANGPPPDTTAPAVSMTSPSGGATVAGTIQVAASASDNVGVQSVQFRLGGANLGAADTSAPYAVSWNTTSVSNGTHTLTAVARDAAGNTATAVPVTVTVSNGTITRFEEDNPALTPSAGHWQRVGPEVATFSGGTAGNSNVAGATIRFTFTGTAVTWIGLKCNVCGIATVSLDGGPAQTVNTAGTAAPGSAGLASGPVFTASGLAAGAHTLLITVTSTTSSGGTNVVVDAFDVTGSSGGAGSATRIEETAPAISYTGSWAARGQEIATFSGGGAGSSNVAGSTATLTFTGRAVTWIGLRCNICGVATVSIDGAQMGTVNTAGTAAPGSAGLASAPVFTASGLAASPHTLVITATGTTSSGGAHVIVDAFDVTP